MSLPESPSNTRRPSWWRRQWIVNPGFQWEITACFGVLLILSLETLHWGAMRILEVAIRAGAEGRPIDPAVLMKDLWRIDLTIAAVTLGLIIVSSIVLTHRIAGPIHRLTRILKSLSGDDSEGPPVTLRKEDYFPELAVAVERLAQQAKKSSIKKPISGHQAEDQN